MKEYTITVTAYIPVPRSREYRMKASAFHVAIAKAIKVYRKDIGRKKIEEMSITARLLGKII